MAPKKGNQHAAGHGFGRPAKFETPEELIISIEEYIKKSTFRKKSRATISGLAYHLGFESRQSLYDYEKRGDDFSYIIRRARLFVESSYENQLYTPFSSGAVFALKNMGWEDRQKIDQVNKNDKELDLSKLTDEELKQLDELTLKAERKS